MSNLGLKFPKVIRKSYRYTATSGQTTFTAKYQPTMLDVFKDNIRLVNGTDYTATNGTSVVLTVGAGINSVIEIVTYNITTSNKINTRLQTESSIKDNINSVNRFTSYSEALRYVSQATTGSESSALIHDSTGNLYWAVGNYYNGSYSLTSYVYKITPNGTVTQFAAQASSGAAGVALAFDSSGNLYWAVVHQSNGSSYNNNSYVYKITPGGTLTTFASQATNGATGTSLVFDTSGDLYWGVTNLNNDTNYNITSYIYKITPGGSLTTFTSVATSGGGGTSLVFDTSGNLYWAVSNSYNGTTYNIPSYVYKITPGGSLTTYASVITNGAVGNSLRFDSVGNLYWAVCNRYNGSNYNNISYVYKITPGGSLTTIASQATIGAYDTTLKFDTPGNLYWAITNGNGAINMTSYVFKIDSDGVLTTFASQGTNYGYGTDIIFDTSGNLYWAVSNFYNGTSYNTNSTLSVIHKQINTV